ncbi:TMEM165/GDT1 family protein [Romeria aff. gracilis LEGE 07310]|uniref:GDT1 family protein n=1 Tax=Vasconcelosia minhoensis LEGE 07310 TaxID=915328 RepID=A0A8J7AM56_9CYAN|nr:TMEM165/GDT1 family protein [Romeria gracilis]MBE9077535.1 TMEM165/GDT1 family protein [Romeria aff. gracilis LEGE 07310]
MLTGFTAGLLLITVSELGDKTFFIGAILAMRHSRRWVFLGVTAALFAMTVLSVLLGQFATVFPRHYVEWVTVALFFGFGFRLLYQAICQSGQLKREATAAAETVGYQPSSQIAIGSLLSKAFTLTFVAEWGDRTQLATITLAAAHPPVSVIAGATLGHAICAAIAVACGRLLCGRMSERRLTALGGILFMVFGAIAAIEASG